MLNTIHFYVLSKSEKILLHRALFPNQIQMFKAFYDHRIALFYRVAQKP